MADDATKASAFRIDSGEEILDWYCVATPHDLVSTGIRFREELPVWTALTSAKEDQS